MFTARELRRIQEGLNENVGEIEERLLDKLLLLAIKHGNKQVQIWEHKWNTYEALLEGLENSGFTVKRHSDYALITWN